MVVSMTSFLAEQVMTRGYALDIKLRRWRIRDSDDVVHAVEIAASGGVVSNRVRSRRRRRTCNRPRSHVKRQASRKTGDREVLHRGTRVRSGRCRQFLRQRRANHARDNRIDSSSGNAIGGASAGSSTGSGFGAFGLSTRLNQLYRQTVRSLISSLPALTGRRFAPRPFRAYHRCLVL